MGCRVANLAATGGIWSKIRACVLIALAGYCLATLAGFYASCQQTGRLSQLLEIHYPLAGQGVEAAAKSQLELAYYHEALVSGSVGTLAEAERLSVQVQELLAEMLTLATREDDGDPVAARIANLQRWHEQYLRRVQANFALPEAGEEWAVSQQELTELAVMKDDLQQQFLALAGQLSAKVKGLVELERDRAQRHNLYLGLFFVLVLVITMAISRCFALRQLIEPLQGVRQLVDRYARKRDAGSPPQGRTDDEIFQLAEAIWHLLRELDQTTVTRDYVDSILRQMNGCFMLLDAEQKLLKINDYTGKLLGYGEDEMVGRPLSDFVAPGSAIRFARLASDLLTAGKEVDNLEIALQTKEGQAVSVLFSATSPVLGEQDKGEIVCLAHDLTQRKKAEEMLRRVAVERATAKSAALAAVGELTAGLTHEMRNPLSSIRMNTQLLQQSTRLLQQGLQRPELVELAEISRQQALRLEKMLNDLLGYGKPLTLRLGLIRMGELLQSVVEAVEVEREQAGVQLAVDDQTDDCRMELDGELMIRALSNLVLNAIQWSPQGQTVELLARFGENSDDGAKQVVFEVRDHGPGVTAEKRHRLFQPFFTTRSGGTGMGLANVKKIVEYHGGTVSAANLPAGGAVFRLELPLVIPS